MLKYLIIVALLSGCATSTEYFYPSVGMPLQEWVDKCSRAYSCQEPTPVGVRGDMQVWKSGTPHRDFNNGAPTTFAYFKNGRLVSIDQGQLFEQRISIRQN